MNRKECEKALNGLRILEREENFKKWNQVAPQIKCDVIETLIHEHFDNPPLKIEELEPNMWVWIGDKNGYWGKIYTIGSYRGRMVVQLYEGKYLKYCGDILPYDENVFYRKMVIE